MKNKTLPGRRYFNYYFNYYKYFNLNLLMQGEVKEITNHRSDVTVREFIVLFSCIPGMRKPAEKIRFGEQQ